MPKPVLSTEGSEETVVQSAPGALPEMAPEASGETFADLPQEGEPVTLIKQSINEDGRSSIAEGRKFDGAVFGSIAVGKKVEIGSLSTSVVEGIARNEDGSFLIKTNTSVYRLERRSRAAAVAPEQVEASVEATPVPLKEGERVVIQKVSMLDQEQAEGDALKGTLRADLGEGVPLAALTEDDEFFDTSVVKRINFEGGKAYVQTASGSVYRVERAG